MGAPRVYSTTFQLLSQCSTLLFGYTTIMPRFHSPILRRARGSGADGIKSYNDPRVRLPAAPSLASGCRSSSNTWYSRPMAEPWAVSRSVTKYFTPLLAPSLNLKSNSKMNAPYCASVTISPPPAASPPVEASTFNTPSFTSQPFCGKVVLYAPRQPVVVLPSHNSLKPAFFSASERLLGIIFTTNRS